MPGRERMAGIETHADPTLILYKGDNIAQVLEARTNHIVRAGHILQHGRDGAGHGGVRAVERVRDARDRLRPRRPDAVARVEVVQPDAERGAPAQVVDEGGVGFGGHVGVVLREVDEVGAVRQDVSVDMREWGAAGGGARSGSGGWTYWSAAYWCSLQAAWNSVLDSSCRGGFSQRFWFLRNSAKAFPLGACQHFRDCGVYEVQLLPYMHRICDTVLDT